MIYQSLRYSFIHPTNRQLLKSSHLTPCAQLTSNAAATWEIGKCAPTRQSRTPATPSFNTRKAAIGDENPCEVRVLRFTQPKI